MPINAQNPFKGRQFPGEVIVLCVRWYLRYPLQLHLALGAGIRTGVEQTLPAASEADQQELSDRRDLYQSTR